MLYSCHVCGGMCDPGELENGVCFDCRKEAVEKKESSTLALMREWNNLVGQQANGQMRLEFNDGTGRKQDGCGLTVGEGRRGKSPGVRLLRGKDTAVPGAAYPFREREGVDL